jgi:capsular polysaccharide biosynthesis protein
VIFYPSYLSIRRDPRNIIPGDEKYFANAKEVQIPDTRLFVAKNVSVLKDHIFQPSKFSFYTEFSHILKTDPFKEYKKLILYFLPFKKVNEGAWITDEWSQEYFHWFTDALPRLYAVEEKYGKSAVILPERFRSVSFVNESLSAMGWGIIFYNLKRRLFVRKLFMVSHTAPNGNYNKEILTKLRLRLSIHKEKSASRYIYISRKKATKRKVINEDEVVRFLQERDVEIYFLEDYSFEQTIQLLSETKCLIGLHGAGLANMLFMPLNGIIVEFRNENDTHNNAYFALASDLDHYYYYLRCKANGIENFSDVYVNLSQLADVLESLRQDDLNR